MRIILLTINFKASTKLHSFTLQHGSRPKNQIDSRSFPATKKPFRKPTARRPPRNWDAWEMILSFLGRLGLFSGAFAAVSSQEAIEKNMWAVGAVGLLGCWVDGSLAHENRCKGAMLVDLWTHFLRERKIKYIYVSICKFKTCKQMVRNIPNVHPHKDMNPKWVPCYGKY